MVLLLPTPSISSLTTALPASLGSCRHRPLGWGSQHAPDDGPRAGKQVDASGLARWGRSQCPVAASHRARGARTKPLPVPGREGGRDGGREGRRQREALGVPAQWLGAGCSQPPGRHKGAQVTNWSRGAKQLKSYSAEAARSCGPALGPAHA